MYNSNQYNIQLTQPLHLAKLVELLKSYRCINITYCHLYCNAEALRIVVHMQDTKIKQLV